MKPFNVRYSITYGDEHVEQFSWDNFAEMKHVTGLEQLKRIEQQLLQQAVTHFLQSQFHIQPVPTVAVHIGCRKDMLD